MKQKKQKNENQQSFFDVFMKNIAIPIFVVILMIPIGGFIYGYFKGDYENVAQKLEENFIYSPVEVLEDNGGFNYHFYLYSYEETKENIHYGIVNSHKLLGSKFIDIRGLSENEEILGGFFTKTKRDVFIIGGHNPNIAKSVIVEVKNISSDETWKREFDLPNKDFFLLTREVPKEFKGGKIKVTYLDAQRNNVTNKIIEANQMNE